MGQQEVLVFLCENQGWYTTREMAEILKVGQNNVNNACRRLFNSGFIIEDMTKINKHTVKCYKVKI